MQFSETNIQCALFRRERQQQLVIPNYTPRHWFECDLFVVTKACHFREYEIKLTASDLRADESKRLKGWRLRARAEESVEQQERQRRRQEGASKHELLSTGYTHGPSQFTYITPEDVAQPDDVPEWAGLIHVSVDKYDRVLLRKVKKPKRLHDQKIEQRVIDHARGVCYWRFWTERQRVERLLYEQAARAKGAA